MTHKVHPLSHRLTTVKDWRSRWFDTKNYQTNLQQDLLIRNYILSQYKNAGIADVEIERFTKEISVIVHTSRPGILIGRGGSGIEEIKKNLIKALRKNTQKKSNLANFDATSIPNLRIEVREVRDTDSHARLVAQNIAEQLERRMPFRRVIKRTLDRVMSNRDVEGVKILVKGRLNGAEMARGEFVKEGKLPLQTLRADIDYAHVEAITKYGVIGVKVWIYKGEKLE